MKDYASWPIDFILLLFILSIDYIRNPHLDLAKTDLGKSLLAKPLPTPHALRPSLCSDR